MYQAVWALQTYSAATVDLLCPQGSWVQYVPHEYPME